MSEGISVNVKTGEEKRISASPSLVPLASLQSTARQKRDAALQDSDKAMLPDSPITNKAAWEEYRQSLRNATTAQAWSTDPIGIVDAIIAAKPEWK